MRELVTPGRVITLVRAFDGHVRVSVAYMHNVVNADTLRPRRNNIAM